MNVDQDNAAEEETQEPKEATNSIADLVKTVLRVSCKGFVVGAGLHVGQKLISGITSKKLTKR